MILDEDNEFADNVALPTGALGRALVTDNINQLIADSRLAGELYLVIQITQAPASGGAAKVAFELVSDSTGSIAVDGSATQHAGLGPYAVADLVVGKQITVALPPAPSYEKYLGLLVNVSGAALTAGRFNAFLTPAPARWTA